MKSLFFLPMLTTAVLVTTALAGCTTPASQQSQGSMGSMDMSSSDMMAMCQGMHAKTPQEQRATMAEHMKNMSPEMRQHCQMHCQQASQSTK